MSPIHERALAICYIVLLWTPGPAAVQAETADPDVLFEDGHLAEAETA